MDNTSPLGFLMFCHSCVLYFYRCHQKIWWKKFFLQRGPSCFVAAGSQIGKMQYKVWPLRLLHCSGLVWVFSGEIPTHFSTFGRKQPRTAVWANYPFKYLHISLAGIFSITCAGVSGNDFWGFGNGKGIEKTHSRNSGMGREIKKTIPKIREREGN